MFTTLAVLPLANVSSLFGVCLRNNGGDHDHDAMKNRVSMENLCYKKVKNKDGEGEEDDAKDLANGINQRKDVFVRTKSLIIHTYYA